MRDISVSGAPDPVPRNSFVRVQVAEYGAPESWRRVPTNSRVRRWASISRSDGGRRADTVFFWAQRWFVVIHWQQADRKALQQFTSALEKRINAGSKP